MKGHLMRPLMRMKIMMILNLTMMSIVMTMIMIISNIIIIIIDLKVRMLPTESFPVFCLEGDAARILQQCPALEGRDGIG